MMLGAFDSSRTGCLRREAAVQEEQFICSPTEGMPRIFNDVL